jgi:hypothetical protein
MEKFTRLKKKLVKDKDLESVKYNSDYYDIIQYKNTEIVNSKDQIVILPFLKDEGFVLLDYQYSPAFNYKLKNDSVYKNAFYFISVIKDNMLENEKPENAIKRVLLEKCNIKLSDIYPINVDNVLFKTDYDIGQYYVSLLELNYNDFIEVQNEKKDNKVIGLSIGELDEIKKFDLITEYLLMNLKYQYKI